MVPLLDTHLFELDLDRPSTTALRPHRMWPGFLVCVFGTMMLGPYPASLDAGGARVQIWRVTFLALASFVVPAMIRAARGHPNVPSLFLALVSLWLGWGLVSFAWTPSFVSGTVELVGLVIGAGLAITIAMVGSQSEDHQRLLTHCWTVVLGLESLLAITEYVTSVHLPSPHSDALALAGVQGRYLTGTFANPNDVAAFLLVGLPFCVADIGTWRRRWQRVAATGAAVLSSIVIVISESRLCTLGLVVGIGAYVAVRKASPRRTYRLRLSYLWLGLAPVALIASKPGVLAKFGNLAAEWSTGGSLRDRVLLLRHGWDAVYGSGFRGIGIGGFEPSVQALPFRLASSGDVNPHNFAMEVLSQYGLVVSVALWSWYALTVMAVRRARVDALTVDRHGFRSRLTTAALVALVVLIPASSDPSSFIEQGTGWLLIGSVLAVAPVRLTSRR